tara:strand:+ start:460 stop:657 length:198 start_codon:yes stop_codon:yes gene_type:complete
MVILSLSVATNSLNDKDVDSVFKDFEDTSEIILPSSQINIKGNTDVSIFTDTILALELKHLFIYY